MSRQRFTASVVPVRSEGGGIGRGHTATGGHQSRLAPRQCGVTAAQVRALPLRDADLLAIALTLTNGVGRTIGVTGTAILCPHNRARRVL